MRGAQQAGTGSLRATTPSSRLRPSTANVEPGPKSRRKKIMQIRIIVSAVCPDGVTRQRATHIDKAFLYDVDPALLKGKIIEVVESVEREAAKFIPKQGGCDAHQEGR